MSHDTRSHSSPLASTGAAALQDIDYRRNAGDDPSLAPSPLARGGPPFEFRRLSSATAAAYQATLPGVRGVDANGQVELVDPGPSETRSAIADEPRLAAAAELVELGQLEFELPGCVLPTRFSWVRGNASAVPWQQLQLRLNGIDRHRGRAWTDRDRETLAALQRQTLNAADLGQRRRSVPSWLSADEIVSPIDGRRVVLTRNPRARTMLEWCYDAYESSVGGVLLKSIDWCAQLFCSKRSVYNYQRELERNGVVELVQTWVPLPDGSPGSRRGPILMRLHPEFVRRCVSISPFERRRPSSPGITMELAGKLGVELRERARLRAFHVSGALYRSGRWSANPQPQKRRARVGTRAAFNRQALPDSPQPGVLLQSASPRGDALEEKEARLAEALRASPAAVSAAQVPEYRATTKRRLPPATAAPGGGCERDRPGSFSAQYAALVESFRAAVCGDEP